MGRFGLCFGIFNESGAVSIDEETREDVERFALHQNYPTNHAGYLLQAHVRLTVYNVLGRRVVLLVDGIRPAGTHHATFNAAGTGPAMER